MDSAQKKLEAILSDIERIAIENESSENVGIELASDFSASLPDIHDQQQMYELFYKGIQRFLAEYLPKGEDITKVIRNLNATILSGHMKNERGVRGGDSRQASVEDYKNAMDAYVRWHSSSPTNYLGLANNLLEKGKELGIIPQESDLSDFLK
ncbi:MAG: hypothetical protein K6E73_10650 [Bacteroidales bacterium]|nr:hypothetical protein [Bacteroidales bacterium]